MADGGRKSEGATAASREGEAMVGCSPASLSSPLSGGGNGGDGDGASSNGAFEPECSLDRFMETLDALSPDGQQLHVNKRQSVESNGSMTPFGGSRARRGSNGSGRNGSSASASFASATPSSCGRATPNLRLRRNSGGGGGGGGGASRMSIGSASGGGDDGDRDGTNSVGSSSTTTTTIPCSSSDSSGLKTPRTGSHHGHFTRVRRNSPVKLDPSSPTNAGGSGRGRGGGGASSGSRSPKRKRSYAQLATYENGAPSPFPSDGAPKSSSRALSNSSLTVHKDGAYMQVTFDDDHRFAHEEDTPMNPLGESLMNDPFLATPEPMPNMPIAERKDIDQALSLLQLSGGSGSQSDLTRSARRNSSGPSSGGKMTPGPASTLFPPLNPQDAVENIVPGLSTGASAAPAVAAHSSAPTTSAAAAAAASNAGWGTIKHPPSAVPGVSSPFPSSVPPPPSPFSMAAAAVAAQRFLPPPPPVAPEVAEKGAAGTRAGTRGLSGGARGGKAVAVAAAAAAAVAGTRAKGKAKAKGAVGGQRPAVQAPVSKPQGTKGGGPGSFCSKPEALSQLDTSQSDQMVLDADLWIVRERGDLCTSTECIYKDKTTGISSRRHYHATCDHRHKKGGPKGGMIFHHHQLEKIQKHQRAHIRTLHKKTPAEAVLSEGNVEPYLPNAWTEEEAGVLAHLVGLYGPTNWGIIAAGVATKSETQCMLHWRFALNGNATVKGTGTWQSVEDERMLSLVQIFGQRWSTVAEHMPGRLAKQCRERYLNNLDPELRRGTWSREEDEKLLQLRGQQNKSFAKIAEQIDGRSYNDVKNRWSQISRQIATLKKQSEKGKGDSNSKVPQKSGSRVPYKRDGEAAAATGADSEAAGEPAGHALSSRAAASATAAAAASNAASRSAGAAHGGSTRRSSARKEAAAAAAAGVAGKATRYKVCLQGGIPTLLEADEPDQAAAAETGKGKGGSEQESTPSPPPAAAAAAAPAAMAKEEPVCSSFRGSTIMGVPPPSCSPSAGPVPGAPASAAAAAAGLPHGVFMGMGLEGVGEAAASAAAAADATADFGPQMTEAEAASIAGGSLFGYGSDMRVSI